MAILWVRRNPYNVAIQEVAKEVARQARAVDLAKRLGLKVETTTSRDAVYARLSGTVGDLRRLATAMTLEPLLETGQFTVGAEHASEVAPLKALASEHKGLIGQVKTMFSDESVAWVEPDAPPLAPDFGAAVERHLERLEGSGSGEARHTAEWVRTLLESGEEDEEGGPALVIASLHELATWAEALRQDLVLAACGAPEREPLRR